MIQTFNLFSQKIGHFRYEDDLSMYVKKLYEIKQNIPNSITHYPEELCYQTPWNLFDLYSLFFPLKNFIISNLEPFFSTKLTFTESWGNIYSKYGNAAFHTHYPTKISGVLYLQVPFKDTLYIYNKFNSDFKIFNPIEGDIYFFEGDQPHRTSVNVSNQDKIVITFNLDPINS